MDVVLQPQGVQPGGHGRGAVPIITQSLHLQGKEGGKTDISALTGEGPEDHRPSQLTQTVAKGVLHVWGPQHLRVPLFTQPLLSLAGLGFPMGKAGAAGARP